MKAQTGAPRWIAVGVPILAAIVLAVSSAIAAPAPPVVGDWQGALSANGGTLHLALHITEDKDGKLGGTMDSLDQNAMGLPITAITFNAPNLHFEIGSVGGIYDGKIGKDNSEIAGQWQQGPASLPLTFTRGGK
jgi:hypothetical protein